MSDKIHTTCNIISDSMTIKAKKIHKDAVIPKRKFPTDAGIDVYSLGNYMIEPHSHQIVKTGVTVEIPTNTVILVWPKSRAEFLIGAGVIDSSYQGEILIKVFNTSNEKLKIEKGQGVAQLVVVPVVCFPVEEVDDIHIKKSERGETGGIAGNAK